jgi:ABC-type glycerol-3-phosphate transport system substrate-binding protein
MRKTLLLLPVALLALSACGGAKNEAAEANETITGDSNTMGEAVSDVNAANAATDEAFTAAENSYEGNVADAGNEIEE